MAEEKEMCPNCKRDILVTNYRMHTLHCARNIMICGLCQEPVSKSEIEEHNEEFHSPKFCDLCNEQVDRKNLDSHKENECGKRKLICQFCEIDKPACEMPDHEGYCGSRTEKCPECGDYVMLKDWTEHQNMRLYHELANKPCAEVFGYSPEVPNIWSGNSNPYSGILNNSSSSTSSSSTGAIPRNYSSSSNLESLPDLEFVRRKSSIAGLEPPSSSSSSPYRRTSITNSSYGGPVMDRRESINNNRSDYRFKTSSSTNSGFRIESNSPTPPSPPPPIPKKSTAFTNNYPSETLAESSILTFSKDDDDVGVEEEIKLPCEFCEELISMYRLIKHQTDCTLNPDSLYYGKTESENIIAGALPHIESSSSLRRLPSHSPSPPRSRQYDFNSSATEAAANSIPSFPKLSITKKDKNASIVGKYLNPPSSSSSSSSSSQSYNMNNYSTNNSNSMRLIAPEAPPRKVSFGDVTAVRPSSSPNVEDGDDDDRERLRKMLSELRKDPFDEDLENNDGSYFPCEFCGDPYPVEFLMRHQLSCDLNPTPVASGDGFNYSVIQHRAEQNMEFK